MNNSTFESLKRKIEADAEEVSQNKGRFSQLKETAKKKYGVDTIAGLKKLRTEKEEKLEMHTAKRVKQIGILESIVPKEVMRELEEENPCEV